MEQLSFLFNEAKVYAEAKAEEEAVVVAAHKRHKKHEYISQTMFPPRWWSTAWRARIWCAPNVATPWLRLAKKW